MSIYGLIKATSLIMRNDTIEDLKVINSWRYLSGLIPIIPIRQSVRQLENAVAMAIENIDTDKLPPLLRGIDFYISILPEIKEKERKAFLILNKSNN
jgi:hypothetical protein